MNQQPMCDDKELLMAYLYGECDAADRRRVEQHLAGCAACTTELADLRGVRDALREWSPPEEALGFRIVREKAAPPARIFRMPAWAQLAAAVLVLAIAAAIANLSVTVGTGGVTIRTGWQKAPAAPVQAQAGTPWRADLVAFEQQMRQEISALRTAATSAQSPKLVAGLDAVQDRSAWLKEVRARIDDMEKRHQQQLDQKMAQGFLRIARDVDAQRNADQRRFLQGLNQIDLRTTQQMGQMRNVLMRVANVQEVK